MRAPGERPLIDNGDGHADLGDGLQLPDYCGHGLASVLPAVARSLGVGGIVDPGQRLYELPAARKAVVVLVDGLGAQLLARRGGHAPFLRSLLPSGRRLVAGFPSTTATSLASLGTGLPPGAHGMIGYEAFDPDDGRLFNELSWDNGPDPVRWQPFNTIFEQAARTIEVTSVGPARFVGSGLTRAALRGPTYSSAERLEDRIDAALAALRASKRALVYLYWGEVDLAGHQHGCQSWQWGEQLEGIDAAIQRLVRQAPTGTAVHITADHGMVDTDEQARIDLGANPELAAGVRAVGGDPRAPHLFVEPGAAAEVTARWRDVLAHRGRVLSRQEAIDIGLFGPVQAQVVPRLGDVVVVMAANFVVLDSRRQSAGALALIGQHGSATEDELAIPLLSVAAR